MSESKLLKHKSFKVNGVKFVIRMLSPSLFMDKDYLLPLSTVTEKMDSQKEVNEKEMLSQVEEFKDKMKDVILKSVVYFKSGILSKKKSITEIIDKIMDNPELYSYLFTVIVNHSLGVKKNYSRLFKLKKISRKQFT